MNKGELLKQFEKNAKNERAQLYTRSVDFGSFSLLTLLKGITSSPLAAIGQFILLPFFALTFSLFLTILAWHRTHIDKENGRIKPNHLVRALTYTISTLAIGVVSVGLFISSAIVSMLSPFILVAAFAAKTVYDGINSIFYAYKAYKEEDEDQKVFFKEKAKTHAYLALGGLVMTAAITAAYVIAFAPLKIIGGIVGLFAGFCMTCYSFARALAVKPKKVEATESMEALLNPITPVHNPELKVNPESALRASIPDNGFIVGSTPATPQNATFKAISTMSLNPFASPHNPSAPIKITNAKPLKSKDPSEVDLVAVGSFASGNGGLNFGTPLSIDIGKNLNRSSTARMNELGISGELNEEVENAPSVENITWDSCVNLPSRDRQGAQATGAENPLKIPNL